MSAAGGRSARLDNFQTAAVWSGRRRNTTRSRGGPDKGQQRELAQLRRGRANRRADADPARVPGRYHQRHHRGGGQPRERPPGAGVSVPSVARLGWYARRAARMSPAEVAWRARDQAVSAGLVTPSGTARQLLPAAAAAPRASAGSPPCCRGGTAGRVPAAARAALLAAADRLMRGEWEVLGVERTDLVAPDWFHDPVTGRRSAPDRYAFRINQRSEAQVGNVKQVWELSRLQHLTLLATAWYLTGDERYARPGGGPAAVLVAAEPLPVRRQLDQRHRGRHPADQPGLDPAAAGRLARRGRPVRGQRARGAADPLAPAVPGRVPEPGLVGQQPRHRRSGRPAGGELRLPVVRAKASAGGGSPRALLERELLRNTFPSGINRELASDYHGFVAELGLLAAVEAGGGRASPRARRPGSGSAR